MELASSGNTPAVLAIQEMIARFERAGAVDETVTVMDILRRLAPDHIYERVLDSLILLEGNPPSEPHNN